MAAIITASVINAFSSNKAADTQASAARDAASSQAAANREAMLFQAEQQKPFREAGIAGQNRLLALLGIGEDKTAADFGKYASAEFGADKFKTDPSYAFRMSEGMKALERSAAARGGLLSGSALKGIQRYGQDLASTEYQNAFNRYQTERTNTLNPFQSLGGVAQSSANTLGSSIGNLMSNTGASNANALMAAGNARASAYQGYGTAAGQALQGINSFFNNSSGGGGGTYKGPDYGTNPSFSNSDFATESYD